MARKVEITPKGIKRLLDRYTPEKAISEYVWNGFDAGATKVEIEYDTNEIGTVSEIRIKDNGTGINHEKLSEKFRPFMDSEKFTPTRIRNKSSVQHGKNGVGRLTFQKFANEIVWKTSYDSGEGQIKEYEISATTAHINQFETTDTKSTEIKDTGTTVVITSIHDITEGELESTILNYLKVEFCWFLELHKDGRFELVFNGKKIDYDDLKLDSENFKIKFDETNTEFHVRFVQWAESLNDEYSKFYYIQSDGKERFKEFTSLNKKGDSFYHSVYVKSDYFDNFDSKIDEESKQETLLRAHSKRDDEYKFLREQLAKYLRKKRSPYLTERSEKLIIEYEKEGVMPTFREDDELDSLKKDSLNQTIRTLYEVEPKLFTTLNTEQKKTFIRFIDLAIESGQRESLFRILKEVVELDEDEREKLSNILSDIRLSNILRTIKLLDDRKETVDDLKSLVFKKDLNANERDQIQKVVESNFWIFGEQYALITAAEQKFKKALLRHWEALRKPKKSEMDVTHSDSKKEMDIFLTRQRVHGSDPDKSTVENVVIELKSPIVNLGKKELDQVERYLRVIKNTDEFNGKNYKWTFILVGNKFHKARDEGSAYIEDRIEKNKVHGDSVADWDEANNYVIYAKTWSTIFSEFDIRHKFIYDKLSIERKEVGKRDQDCKENC